MYIYIYIYIYIYHENNVLSRLSPQYFVATHALGHMMYGWTLLVPTNEPKSPQQSK